MTTTQFKDLKAIFAKAQAEVVNDDKLADWLIDLGGNLIAIGVSLTADDDEED